MVALVWANLHPQSYRATFEYRLTIGAGGSVATFTSGALISDGLMTLFFFVVGMEIKRELVVGELNTLAKASLPAIAALGGMLLPAAIFLAFTWGSAHVSELDSKPEDEELDGAEVLGVEKKRQGPA